MKPWKKALISIALAAVAARESNAHAQEVMAAGSAHIGSGVESGGGQFMRARTRLRLAIDLRVDESPDDGIEGAAIVDLEPHAALGGDFRYMRLLGSHAAVSGGVIAYAVPGTLLGGCAGFDIRVPLGKSMALSVGPDFTIFGLGTDLPDGTVFWQGLLQVGVRVGL